MYNLYVQRSKELAIETLAKAQDDNQLRDLAKSLSSIAIEGYLEDHEDKRTLLEPIKDIADAFGAISTTLFTMIPDKDARLLKAREVSENLIGANNIDEFYKKLNEIANAEGVTINDK
jgi:hypothetical protein